MSQSLLAPVLWQKTLQKLAGYANTLTGCFSMGKNWRRSLIWAYLNCSCVSAFLEVKVCSVICSKILPFVFWSLLFPTSAISFSCPVCKSPSGAIGHGCASSRTLQPSKKLLPCRQCPQILDMAVLGSWLAWMGDCWRAICCPSARICGCCAKATHRTLSLEIHK